jgi:NTE family protein
MLFHLGALWRLNDLGYLPKLDRVSSVSGGSITAAALATKWSQLDFDPSGVGREFVPAVVQPVRSLAGRTIDVWAILAGLLILGLRGSRTAGFYRHYLLGKTTLQDLPDRPRFVFNATSLQSGVLWRFSKPYMWDYRVGKISQPSTELATVVAASAAFPPFLSPVFLHTGDSDYIPGSGLDLQRSPYTTRVVLTDGGVYDNLGLETAWKRYRTILISDGGGAFGPVGSPSPNWLFQVYRVLTVVDSQVRSLRKRQAIHGFLTEERTGTYWGIRSHVEDYQLSDALPCPSEQTARLAALATRLKRLSPEVQERLINWGYAVCDTAMRRHVEPAAPPPKGFPYPAVGVGLPT